MTTNEAALKLARSIIAAEASNAGAKALILEGAWDRTETMRCALAAILEVTERAANHAAIWDGVVAMSLRNQEHLS